jgi:hypothetical protein
MKKRIIFLIASIVVVLFNGCVKAKKNVEDYFVKVSTVSATVQDDGSVLVTGRIESEGGSPVENIGFCCGTAIDPKLEARQMEGGSFDGSTFRAIYEDLSKDSTYYFRAWATNSYGYKMGSSIAVKGITPAPVVPTCTFSLGYLDLDAFPPENNLGFFTKLSSSFNTYYSNGGSSFTNVQIRFYGIPKTGVYQTEASYDPSGKGRVFVSFNRSTIFSSLNSGSNVYVNEISPGVFDVVICDGSWTYNATNTFSFDAHFQVSL